MKRIVCLMLAFMLLSGIALADSAFGFSMQDYYGCANSFLPRFGYEVEWDDVTEEIGVTCLELTYPNLIGEHGVYLMADPVMAVNVVYLFTVTEDDAALDANLNAFSQLTTSALMCAWIADHAAAEDLQQQLSAALTAANDEFTALVEPLLVMDESFDGKASKSGTLFGYPAVFELDLDLDTLQCILSLHIAPPADVSL